MLHKNPKRQQKFFLSFAITRIDMVNGFDFLINISKKSKKPFPQKIDKTHFFPYNTAYTQRK